MTSTGGARAMRADAHSNRLRILEAAREALAESGDATMQSIAKAAGVGQGTLYRHFATREALVLEVHRKDVGDLIAAAPLLLGQHPPLVALRAWFDLLASYGRIKLGLAGAIHSVMRAKLSDEGFDPVADAITMMLDAGKQAGEVRDDVDAEDVLLLVGFLWRIEGDHDWESRANHLLDLVMDCLRPAPSPSAPARAPRRRTSAG